MKSTLPRISDLFKADSQRANNYCLTIDGLYCDFSKCHLDDATLNAQLHQLEQQKLTQHIDALFSGQRVNTTEQRPALHTALRQQDDTAIYVNQLDILPEIRKVQQRMQAISEKLRSANWLGYDGQAITDVVSIGIGGSDLGPVLANQALDYLASERIHVHFLSNIDGSKTAKLLQQLQPATTLFIVASKSFSTQETLTNADTCRQWLVDAAGNDAACQQHFLAITAKPEKAIAYGIKIDNILPFWDWVGGRYSLWSAIGLPVAIAIGMPQFQQLLAGAAAMDAHFRNCDLRHNLPVLLAVIGDYYINHCNASTQAIIPYDETLGQLSAYVQQLDMESNGKSVRIDGEPVSHHTAPIIWGATGTNSQHSCHQLLHQGTQLVPIDFIIAKKPHHHLQQHHDILLANCLAQAQALMQGKNFAQAKQELLEQGISEAKADQLAKHKVIAGNKPSTLIMLEQITPYNLGMLIALYEHKVFVQSILWQINAFDQWGVELGKQLGERILHVLDGGQPQSLDASTTAAIKHYLK